MAINYFAPVRLMLGLLPGMVERGDGHVVNILTWGVQVKAPKFSAYIASKTALDVFSRIAGRELYGDGVTFTNIRMSLVRTAMIGPTDAYRRAPALSPEQAAEKVVRALEDRPLTVNVVAGNVAEVFNLVAPRLSDAFFHRVSLRFPDSKAAARHVEPQADSAAS
jgi:short-subunit dehydrogenase